MSVVCCTTSYPGTGCRRSLSRPETTTPKDIGAWKYYESANSGGQFVQEEFEAYLNATNNRRLVYHNLLIEATEALLNIEFGKYINPQLPTHLLDLRDWTVIDGGFCLNKTFYAQVYDHDESFQFNYCEYVLARRLESAEPPPATVGGS